MSHIKGGEKLGEIALGRQESKIFILREERGAGLFETIIREVGARQMILREEGG